MALQEINQETNLTRILRFKMLSAEAVGKVIGVNQPQTVRRKLQRQHPFKLGEAKKLHHELLPEYDFDYLFADYVDINEDPQETAKAAGQTAG